MAQDLLKALGFINNHATPSFLCALLTGNVANDFFTL